MWLHLAFIFLYSVFLISTAIIVSLAIYGSYNISSLLKTFYVNAILQAIASLAANLVFLYLLNRIVDSIAIDHQTNRTSLQHDIASDEINDSAGMELDETVDNYFSNQTKYQRSQYSFASSRNREQS